MDLRGRLPLFIQNLFSERKLLVRVGSSLAEFYDQEIGVSQGSILSVTPFIVKINSITRCMRNGVDKSLCWCLLSFQTHAGHRKAASTPFKNIIEDWADNNGFKFTQSKTVCVHFCRRSGPCLVLYNKPIPVQKEMKFLGILLNSKLTFVPHINGLKKKCQGFEFVESSFQH